MYSSDAVLTLSLIYSLSYIIFSPIDLVNVQGLEQTRPSLNANANLSLNETFKNENSSTSNHIYFPVNILNPSQKENSTALGSGFIYDNRGHVVTDNCVVANTKVVDVTF